MLSVKTLAVAYGPIEALQDVSIDVHAGEIVTVVGPNGAGKSTLLRAISGLLHPMRGHIVFEDQIINKMSSHKRVAMGLVQVPEGRAILRELTTNENLQVALEHGRDTRLPKDVFLEVYNLFPILSERKGQLAGTLSGGEQQMLAIARALVAKPKLLLLDEPSLGLGPLFVLEVFQTIQALRLRGVSILLVEQNVRQALRIADRGYVLRLGRTSISGSAAELSNHPEILHAYLGSGSAKSGSN